MITKKVFKDLAIFMIGFGIMMGIVFPFFVTFATEADPDVIMTPLFFTLCITAGFLVGLFNIFLARKVVAKKLKKLSTHMGMVETKLSDGFFCTGGDNFDDPEKSACFLEMNLEDEFEECAKSFNAVVASLAVARKAEKSVKDFSDLLSTRLELDKLSIEALDRLVDIFGATGGAIIIEKSGELQLLSSYGIKEPESLVENDMVWQVFKNSERLTLKLPEEIILNGVVVDYRPKTVIIEPLMYKEVVLGAILLATVDEFSESMENILRQFGQGLSLALKNAITHDQLQRLAADDPLTGIFNRRFGLLRLRDEFTRAVKTDTALGIIMFDIDYFKKVNDTYGHLVGDRVLVGVAKATQSVLRDGDVFLRYGGEEFLVALPGASIYDALQIAERIRHVVRDTVIYSGAQEIKVTVSLGGTSFPERESKDIFGLIGTADEKLYQAKESGRNMSIVN